MYQRNVVAFRRGGGLRGPTFGQILGAGSAVNPEPISRTAMSFAATIANMFSMFGRGRKEADMIVPTQNDLMKYIGAVTDNYKLTNSVPQLQEWLAGVQDAAQKFQAFVSDPRFTDGRASHQARNSVFPYIDGTDGEGNAVSVSPFGDPIQPGGLIGALQSRIVLLGGALPVPMVTQGIGTSTIPQLAIQQPGTLYQSGVLNPQPPGLWSILTGTNTTPPSIQPVRAGMDNTTMLLIAGVGLSLLLSMRSRR